KQEFESIKAGSGRGQEWLQRTPPAIRNSRSALLLRQPHDEGVKLVEQAHVGRERRFEPPPQVFMAFVASEVPGPVERPRGVASMTKTGRFAAYKRMESA